MVTSKMRVAAGYAFVLALMLSAGVVNAADTLAGWWRFDDGSGTTAVDSSGNGTDGTLQNGPTWTTGPVGGALSFDGVDDYVSLPTASALNITGPISMSAWIKTTGTGFMHIVGGYNSAGSPWYGYGMCLGANTPGKVGYWSSNYGAWVESNSTVNDGNWHHVAVAVSGTTATFYLDGAADGTASTQQPGSYSGVRAIGARSDGQYCFVGQLDEVRIFSNATNSTTVGASMAQSFGGGDGAGGGGAGGGAAGGGGGGDGLNVELGEVICSQWTLSFCINPVGTGGSWTDCGCPKPDSSTSSTGNTGSTNQGFGPNVTNADTKASVIDNLSFNHIHYAMDYQTRMAANGCCGSGAQQPDAGVSSLHLMRIHRYRDVAFDGSFGPGVFSNFDTKLYLNIVNGSNVIDLWDPEMFNVQRLIDGPYTHEFSPSDPLDGVYTSFKTNSHKELRLYDSGNALTTNQANGATAVLEAWDGRKLTFEIVTIAGAQVGRLTKIEDRDGYAYTITYKYAYPTYSTDVLWQMDTVTDPHGKVATFTYAGSQVSGRWVVSQIDFPNSTSVTYSYSSGYLSGVSFPDGTASTMTRSFNAASGCAVVDYFDAAAEGFHRTKKVYLTTNFTTLTGALSDDIMPSSAQLVRMVVDGSGEVSYMNGTHPSYSFYYVFEGNGVLKQIYCGWQIAYAKTWTMSKGPNDSWNYFSVAPDLESTFEFLQYSSANSYQEWYRSEPEYRIDERGLRVDFTYNSAGSVTSRTYPDSTTETFDYNGFQQVTKFKDRDDRITEYTYDSRGNRTSETVGEKLVASVVTTTAETATFNWSYYSSGNANQFLMKDHTDANTHVTDYAYNSNHFLTSITQPPDVTSGPRGETDYTYDSTGRMNSMTDPFGRLTSYSFDDRNRVTTITHNTYPTTSTETFAYGSGSNANLLTDYADQNGNITHHVYDASGRETTMTYGYGSSVAADKVCAYKYGSTLRANCVDKGDKAEYGHDYRNRLVTTTVHPNTATSLTSTTVYTDNSVSSNVDPYNRKTFYVYDANLRVKRVVRELIPGAITTGTNLTTLTRSITNNPDYVIEEMEYDGNGDVVARVDGRNVKSTSVYDSRVQLTTQIEADTRWNGSSWIALAEGGKTAYEYDAQGNRTKVIMPRSFDRVSGSFVAGSEGEFSTTFEYTNRNLLKKKTEAAGLDATSAVRAEKADEQFTYYLDGRILTKTDGRGNVWTTKWRSCCPIITGQLEPIARVDDSGTNKYATTIYGTDYAKNPTYQGRVTLLTDSDTEFTEDFRRNPDDAVTFNEMTTHYDERNRPDAKTVWLSPLTSAAGNAWLGVDGRGYKGGDANTPGTGNYLKTTYRYDENLTDGSGIDADYATQIALLGGGFFGTGSDGFAVEATNPAGEKSVMIYDGIGRVVLSIDGNGNATKHVYDTVTSNQLEVAVTDAVSHTTKSHSDGAGHIRETVDASNKASEFAFDPNGNVAQVRDPNSVGYDVVFDYRNRETQRTDTQSDVTGMSYDGNSNVITRTDALTNSTTCAYDGRDRKTSCVDRLTHTTGYTYDANNNLLTLTDSESHATTYTYDPRNLLATETYADSGVRSYLYDPVNRLYKRTDQVSVDTSYAYDMANRLTTRGYPDSLNDTFAYDTASRLISAASARYANTVTRDYTSNSEQGGRLQGETLSILGQTYTTTYAYSADNLQTDVYYPSTKHVERTFTPRHQLNTVVYDGTNVTTLTYDDGMRRTTSALHNGRTDTIDYGTRLDNLPISKSSDGSTTNFAYGWDANKRKSGENDSIVANDVQTFGYDNEDRLTSFDRSSVYTQAWTLSNVGDWSAFNDNGSSQSRTHNNVHELTAIGATALNYDVKGNLAANNVNSQTYAWDFENRLQSAIGSSVQGGSYAYDALGRRVMKSIDGANTIFVSDGLQEISEYEQSSLWSTADIGSVGYTGSSSVNNGVWSLAGSGTDIWDTVDAFRYTYRTLHGDGSIIARITSLDYTDSWAKAGVMIRESLNANSKHTMVCVTPGQGVSFQRRTTTGGYSDHTTTGGPTAPYWVKLVRIGDAFSGYVSSDGTSWTLQGSVTISMNSDVYIGLETTAHNNGALCHSTLAHVSVNGAPSTGAATPTLASSYVFGSYIDEPLMMSTGGSAYYYHANNLYSVAALTDSGGSVVERYRYDPYGKVTILAANGTTVRTASSYGNPWMFTGRRSDAETGLMHYRARYYSTELGRFLSRDPIQYKGGMNLYEYANGKSTTKVDPLGLESGSSAGVAPPPPPPPKPPKPPDSCEESCGEPTQIGPIEYTDFAQMTNGWDVDENYQQTIPSIGQDKNLNCIIASFTTTEAGTLSANGICCPNKSCGLNSNRKCSPVNDGLGWKCKCEEPSNDGSIKSPFFKRRRPNQPAPRARDFKANT
jgi:RHS repeat-associated protein